MAAIVAVWLATLVLPPVILLRVREGWLAELNRPEAQAHWDEFRRDMRQQSGRDGPVQRKVRKSAEPPARVWLRDFFLMAVVAWVLFAGVLGGFFCLLVAGVLRGASRVIGSEPEQPPAPTGPETGPRDRSLAQDQSCRQHDDDKQHQRDGDDAE
jgi:hypothetical protein